MTIVAGQAYAGGCSNGDFYGRYAMQSENAIVGGPAGAWAAGTLYADGNGVITEWTKINTFVSPATGEKLAIPEDVVAGAAGLVTYEVMPNCRITIRFVNQASDQAVELQGGVAYGGAEVLAVAVLPKGITGGYVFKSSEANGKGKKESMAAIETLLRRLAVRNGIAP